jgi:hypothetical protein
MGIGFSEEASRRVGGEGGVELTTHLYLVPVLRKNGAIFLLSLYASWRGEKKLSILLMLLRG